MEKLKKSFIILVILLLMGISGRAYSQWEIINDTIPNSVFVFMNKTTGFLAPDSHSFYKTTDGGITWNLFKPWRVVFGLEKIDSLCLYASGGRFNDNKLYRTFDGGVTWDSVYGPADSDGEMSFVNRETGWMMTQWALYKTNDGGRTWDICSNIGIGRIYMIKQNYNGYYYGYAILGSNGFYKTTNSGVNWTQLTTASMNNYFYLNKDTGWAQDGGSIKMTTDGGYNWVNQYYNPDGSFAQIYFYNARTGWIGTTWQLSRIYVTTNGGETWGNQPIGVWPNFYGSTCISFLDSVYGYCGRSQLARTTNGGGVILYTNNHNIIGLPDGFELKQNYPNPFNPSTVIEFSLVKPSVVTLSVYDVTGRELLRVYDGEKIFTGRYRVRIDTYGKGNNIFTSSGIYFYRIRAEYGSGVFMETKKMVYLK